MQDKKIPQIVKPDLWKKKSIYQQRNFQILAFAVFLIQMGIAFEHYFSSPSTKISETKSIWSIKQPIQITICKVQQFVDDLGFKNGLYYPGIKTDNKSFLSWTDVGGEMTANETMYWLFQNSTELIGFDDWKHGVKQKEVNKDKLLYFFFISSSMVSFFYFCIKTITTK